MLYALTTVVYDDNFKPVPTVEYFTTDSKVVELLNTSSNDYTVETFGHDDVAFAMSYMQDVSGYTMSPNLIKHLKLEHLYRYLSLKKVDCEWSVALDYYAVNPNAKADAKFLNNTVFRIVISYSKVESTDALAEKIKGLYDTYENYNLTPKEYKAILSEHVNNLIQYLS